MQSLTLQWISKVFSLRNSHFILFFLYFVYLNLDGTSLNSVKKFRFYIITILINFIIWNTGGILAWSLYVYKYTTFFFLIKHKDHVWIGLCNRIPPSINKIKNNKKILSATQIVSITLDLNTISGCKLCYNKCNQVVNMIWLRKIYFEKKITGVSYTQTNHLLNAITKFIVLFVQFELRVSYVCNIQGPNWVFLVQLGKINEYNLLC